MNFSIIPLYSGKRSRIYTIQFENEELSEFYNFVFNYQDEFPSTIWKLNEKLKNMTKTHGIINEFFKRESPTSHNVFRLENTNDLRIYCIKFSNVAIILGDGGQKKSGTTKLSENPHLEIIVNKLMEIEDLINKKIESKEIKITCEAIEGDLTFSIEVS